MQCRSACLHFDTVGVPYHLLHLNASSLLALLPPWYGCGSDVCVDLVAKTSTCLLMLPGTFKLQQQIPGHVSQIQNKWPCRKQTIGRVQSVDRRMNCKIVEQFLVLELQHLFAGDFRKLCGIPLELRELLHPFLCVFHRLLCGPQAFLLLQKVCIHRCAHIQAACSHTCLDS